jgi:hypothetical protein
MQETWSQKPFLFSVLPGMSAVTNEHETLQLGAHVIFRDMLKKVRFRLLHYLSFTYVEQIRIGCIREILISTATLHSVAFVALQVFSFMPAHHPLLHLPCLLLTDEELVVSGMVSFT